MARKGATPSQIGVTLRDSHGIPQVKGVTGSKILRILKNAGMAPALPEDLHHLIRKAINIRKHLEKNRQDLELWADGELRDLWLSNYYFFTTSKLPLISFDVSYS